MLDPVTLRDTTGIARTLGATVTDNRTSSGLHPTPRAAARLALWGVNNTRFVTPDIIVRKVRDEWTVMLNPDVVPRVRLNRMYADLFRSHRDSRHSDLAAQLQEARWTVRNVEQRFSTILCYCGTGNRSAPAQFPGMWRARHETAGLREIAEELGLHESTVSRVTNDEYMATPLGVFELKFFFSRALATANGGTSRPRRYAAPSRK